MAFPPTYPHDSEVVQQCLENIKQAIEQLQKEEPTKKVQRELDVAEHRLGYVLDCMKNETPVAAQIVVDFLPEQAALLIRAVLF